MSTNKEIKTTVVTKGREVGGSKKLIKLTGGEINAPIEGLMLDALKAAFENCKEEVESYSYEVEVGLIFNRKGISCWIHSPPDYAGEDVDLYGWGEIMSWLDEAALNAVDKASARAREELLSRKKEDEGEGKDKPQKRITDLADLWD